MAAVAFPEELAAHRQTVRGFLARLLRDESLAEDLVQEALIRARRAAASMRGDSAPRTWLMAIALNLARDHFRTAKRRPAAAGLEAADCVRAPDDPERDVLRAEMSSCILEYIDRLAANQREAVLMHYFAGLSHKEIAIALGVSQGNARVLLHRGLAKLKESLGRDCAIDLGDDIPCERR